MQNENDIWNGVFWHHLIYPQFSVHEVEDPALSISAMHEALMGGQFPDFVVCLALDDYDKLTGPERRRLLESVRRCIRDGLPARQRMLVGFAHGNSLYFCGMLPGDKQADAAKNAVIEQIDSFRKRLSSRLAQSATAGIAFITERSLDAWRSATQLAVVAQRKKVRSGFGRTYIAGQTADASALDLSTIWTLAERLHRLVRSGDTARAHQEAPDILRVVFTDNYLPLSHLRPILQSQVVFMARAAVEAGVDAVSVAARSENYLESLSHMFDYASMQEMLWSALEWFTDAVHDCHLCRSSRLVAQADEYMMAHLTDPNLGLDKMAADLGTNASYLSRLYKRERGEGITRSINRRRVEMAKPMLLDNRLTVAQIAFELGFGSVQHFGRVFREMEGCSPSVFRRQKLIEFRKIPC